MLPEPAELAAVYALESIKGFGPQKFRELTAAGLTAMDVVEAPSKLPIAGRRGEGFRQELTDLAEVGIGTFEQRARNQLERARDHGANILIHGDARYPKSLWESNNPVPVLYVCGDLSHLHTEHAIACVGSRAIKEPYQSLQHDFAAAAATDGWLIVSGFATGADTVSHRAARDGAGVTACVMPSGLDRPFPPENKALWQEFLDYPGAVLVSEFPFGTAASKLTLSKRNKTIVGLSRGALIGQASATGGAMYAFRFAQEQHKPVATFAGDGSEDTSGNATISRSGGTTFPADYSDHHAWGSWLSSLISTT
ncbi:MAG: processing protein [Actinomycetota bacterium]|nr:processing protein [Actinomycetota bacterium]